MPRERANKVEVVPSRRGQLIRSDQVVLLLFFRLPICQQLFENGQARLFLLELVHHLELAAQPEFGGKQSQHAVKKTVDRTQRQVPHAVHQPAQRGAKLRRPGLLLSHALGQALGLRRIARRLGQFIQDALEKLACCLASERQCDDSLRRLAAQQQPDETVGELKRLP